MSQAEGESLLVSNMWDVRACLEAQVRCLIVLEQTLGAFRKTTDTDARVVLRAKMLRDFAEIEGLSFTVLRMLKPAIREAMRELNAA